MILNKLFLRVQDDLSLVRSIVTAGIGFFVGQEMHELEFDAQMIQSLMDILGQFHPEGTIESGDIAHDLRLSKHVVVSEERFVGGAIEGDDITEHSIAPPTKRSSETTKIGRAHV